MIFRLDILGIDTGFDLLEPIVWEGLIFLYVLLRLSHHTFSVFSPATDMVRGINRPQGYD